MKKKTLKKYNKKKKIKKIKEKKNNSGGHRVPHIPCFEVFLGFFWRVSRKVIKKKEKGSKKGAKKKRKRKGKEKGRRERVGRGESKEKNGPMVCVGKRRR